MKSLSSEKIRHLLLRGEAHDVLPDAIAAALDKEQVACGWLRASGVLAEVQLRALGDGGVDARPRRIAGPVQVALIEGSVGLANGALSVGLRAVIARETESGLEAIAGEIVSARVVALEAHVTAFDDVSLPRALDEAAGVWLLGEPAPSAAVHEAPPRPVVSREVPKPSSWGDVIAASGEAERAPTPRPPVAQIVAPPAPAPAAPAAAPATPSGAVLPPRPVRRTVDDDQPLPEAGDLVEHFAFGPCEVIKSDGDRLHLRVHKDGRIKEIATEMLRVIPLASEGERRKWKLERKL